MNRTAAYFVSTSAASILVIIATFVSGVLLARALGPSGRAVYGSVLIFSQLIAGLGCLSFFEGSIVFLRKRGGKIRPFLPTMFLSAVALGTITSVIGLYFFLWGFDFSGDDLRAQIAIVAVSGIVVMELLWQFFSAAERSQMKFFWVNFTRVAIPLLFGLLVALAWIWRKGELSASFVILLFLVSKLPVLIVVLWRYGGSCFGRVSIPFLLDAGRTGLRLHIAVAIMVIAGLLDRLFAIGVWSTETLGQYFVAFSAVGAGYSVVTSAVNTVLFPYLSGMKHEERRDRLSLIIRLTLLISFSTLVAGWVLLPIAIPFFYGTQYVEAVSMALGLLIASSMLPLRAIVLEANRSTGHGRPSVEMAGVSIGVMWAMYLLTDFEYPNTLILAFGLANLISMLFGVRHLVKDGSFRFDSNIVPTVADVRYLLKIFVRVAR